MAEAGYSGVPLPRKLGVRPGQRLAFVGVPDDLLWVGEAAAPSQAERFTVPDALPSDRAYDAVWAFFTRADALHAALPRLRAAIAPAGMIWISWPKKAAKTDTDLTEDRIRAAALAGGLVDVKVCAVDATWSGLKLVIPLKLRG